MEKFLLSFYKILIPPHTLSQQFRKFMERSQEICGLESVFSVAIGDSLDSSNCMTETILRRFLIVY